MISKVELLVHAGAASTRKNDARCKAQAVAYLDFRGTRTGIQEHEDSAGNDYVSVLPVTTPGYLRGEQPQMTALHEQRSTTGNPAFLDETQLAINALESQIITASLDAELRPSNEAQRCKKSFRRANLDNIPEPAILSQDAEYHLPKPPKRQRDDIYAGLERTSPEAQAEAASLSSYLASPALDRSNKKRRLDVQPAEKCLTRDTPLLPPITVLDQSEVSVMLRERMNRNERRSQGSFGSNRASSELPTSYSLSDITSESSRTRQRLSQRSTSDPEPQTSLGANTGLVDVERNVGVGSWPFVRGRTIEQPTVTHAEYLQSGHELEAPVETTIHALTLDIEGVQRVRNPASEPSTLKLNECALFVSLSTSIHPPEPPVGFGDLETQVTWALRSLAEQSVVSDLYHPVEQTRDVQPLERGHWIFDPSSWPPETQVDLWAFLEKVVGSGDAGWGIWCSRGNEDDTLDDVRILRPGHTATSHNALNTLGKVRIFCWGEVIKHIYLMLYVASKSRTRKSGLKWIDADGKTIVRMRGP